MKSMKLLQCWAIFICSISACLADPVTESVEQPPHPKCAKCITCTKCLTPVEARAMKEEFIPLPYIAIAFYKPTYALPFYYTGSPYNAVYKNLTPHNESVKSSEFKYQVSLKAPIWEDILGYSSSLYFAYTLRTYWQLYNRNSFIRETDYQPEFFIANEIDYPIMGNWLINFVNVGYDHQSNGYGNSLQRSWDRIYLDAISSTDHWMISFRPWYIAAKNNNNTNIGSYLGYARFLVSYKFCLNVFSFEITNLFVTPKRTSGILTWSFPITPHIKGYVEIFSGYGQSLIEYNHRTNSAGIGFAVSDWI